MPYACPVVSRPHTLSFMTTTKVQRWLDLLAVLVGRRLPVSVDEIMERVPAYRDRWLSDDETARESVRRMFERDKDELRGLGLPLRKGRRRDEGLVEGDGYLIPRRDFYLPYLRLVLDGEEGRSASPHAVGRVELSEEEARTAVVALREVLLLPSFPFRHEARRALRKLTFDLDPVLVERSPEEGDELDPRVRILDRPGGADPEGVLGTLLDALYARHRVRFRYHSIGRDAKEEREVEPWGLLFQWGAWYLAARDAEREGDPEPRLFRVDRMAGARFSRPGTSGPDFDVPEGFDLRAYAGRRAWDLREEGATEEEVVVRFLPPLSRVAMRNGWGTPLETGEGKEAGSEALLRRFSVQRLDPFLRWVLSLAGEAEVVSPRRAADELARMAQEVLRLYREEA